MHKKCWLLTQRNFNLIKFFIAVALPYKRQYIYRMF